ncbi:GGDEF domain-containing protein [Sulfuricurvum sp.]|uniref:GGDEF domain-containing protein n=1 Tax=Sulfuricurvum sp. TaxID=2025608 RepID=UPI00261C1AEB|nr:GGDEF domain-containing protein [Sulfuricurvum sp.]MDD2781359.1 GGDEF domain-containing protein [Sulfuricurvum sp.]
MDGSSLSKELLFIQENEKVPYDLLSKFAEEPKYLELYIQKYGLKFYQKCIFSLTHISFDVQEAQRKWDQIIKHRKELNTLLKRDVGLKVAAFDFLDNFAIRDFDMSVIETGKIADIVDFATTDQLTALYVRSIFDEILYKEFEQYLRNKNTLSLLMIDIDDFKTLNDTYGHQKGDDVLRKIGEILLDTVRKSDIACRYGGEELSVIMPHTDMETAFDVAERIRKTIENTDIDGIKTTISIGVSETTESLKDAEELVKQADDALYLAKNEGKNRVCKSNETIY